MLCFDVTGLYPQPPWWRRLFSAPSEIGFQVLKDQNYEKSTGNTSQLNTVQRKHGANYSFAIINGSYKFLTCFFVTSNGFVCISYIAFTFSSSSLKCFIRIQTHCPLLFSFHYETPICSVMVVLINFLYPIPKWHATRTLQQNRLFNLERRYFWHSSAKIFVHSC